MKLNKQMITGEIKSAINKIWDDFWTRPDRKKGILGFLFLFNNCYVLYLYLIQLRI